MIYDKTKFATKKELHRYLKENEKAIIIQKKSIIKSTDATVIYTSKKATNKAQQSDTDVIEVIAVGNTTNYMDSHDDVHFPGIWAKTLNENRNIFFQREHKDGLENIIADGDDLKVYTEMYKWQDLGFDYIGETQALIADAKVRKSRNEFMFNQFKNGWVRQFSVQMQYVKLSLALDNPDEPDNFKTWEQYIDTIANKERPLEYGYFWAIMEAKLYEISAVKLGSNDATLTLSTKNEPSAGTHKNITQKPSKTTLLRNIL